ncbi:putative amidohydrolase YtcJ [Arthrobacter sp. V1I9]|jgi:predicted amidohydrolase YtcJ|uniref:amidohydrolase n=1 Tax=Arthrobacter sp. V1I9 TaxID=3042275 RepID=UPI00279288A6|nr:amidohydrolase [Arthrobacter sp. V1I9]MDQ0870960.1 putative amidohydrolase YtcJ [Arthrobacter sp. V1I9]
MLDLKLVNASIFTMAEAAPTASAMGVLNGRIVGLDADVLQLPAQRTLDCGSAVVVPGFGDSHNHMAWFGQSLAELDLSRCRTLNDMYDAVSRFASELPDGAWVVGSGYDDTVMGGHPHRNNLDRSAPGRPVWLKHRSGHMCTVNTEVLERAGILDGSVDIPEGGTVVRDTKGPTGLLEEQAQKLVTALVVPYPVTDLADAIGAASEVYASEGLTHVVEAGIGSGWIGRSPVELAAYLEARRRGLLKTRVQLMAASDALHPLQSHATDAITFGLDLGIASGFGDDQVRLGAMKIFIDGSLIGRTAAVTEPFCDHGHGTGSFQLSLEELTRRIVDAHCSGWNVAAHAIGDSAVDVALDAFAAAQQKLPRPEARHRIEHAGMVRPDQLSRFASLGITPVPQPHFLFEVGDTMAAAVGPERVPWLYRHKSFLDLGVRVPGSSDRPVASGAPLLGMQSMVTRRSSGGTTLSPQERVDAGTALRAYTVDAAWTAGEEDRRGTLESGKLADFVFLSAHPADVAVDEIGQITVLATVLGGTCVFGQDYLDDLPTAHPTNVQSPFHLEKQENQA